jgi:dihydrofolate reductase
MKITIYIATSANGYISNSRNVPDWLSDEYGSGMMEICNRYRAVIMGRTTYDIIAPDYLPFSTDGIMKVMSRQKDLKSANATVHFTSEAPREIVSSFELHGYSQAVIIGGTQTMSAFFQEGLVDDIYLVFEPVFFGRGLPLFEQVEFESKLNLLEFKKLNSNTTLLHYEVRK